MRNAGLEELQAGIKIGWNYLQLLDKKLWKILKEMGIPDHLTCLLRNLYVGQEATVRTLYGTTDWSRLRKEYHPAVCCHPVSLTYTLSTS